MFILFICGYICFVGWEVQQTIDVTRHSVLLSKWMIRNYRDRDTERLAAGEKVRRWEPLRKQMEKRLRILDAATSLGDLAALNSNRLEALKGSRNGQHSIRINEQWRICFRWPQQERGPVDVEIVDYH